MPDSTQLSCDIFCAVIDNYGDIGVCWRLARQLYAEHEMQVRLWVDDPARLFEIAPSAKASGIDINVWKKTFPDVEPADIVIEAFACKLPDGYVETMAAREVKPVWINLEYLSAEDWVTDCHLALSRHPVLSINKYFFFPGFTAGSGGLLREAGLGQNFESSAFWKRLGVSPQQTDEIRVSLFGYDNPALHSLLESWVSGHCHVTCLLPQGALAERAKQCVGEGRGMLRVYSFPMLPQDDYDRLLWACDCNFVRGEDSLVRAQWAGRPFVWHIYKQQQQAHLTKLDAFLDLYCRDLSDSVTADLRQFWHNWNRGESVDWNVFWRNREAIEAHTAIWKSKLLRQDDLAAQLVIFCRNKV